MLGDLRVAMLLALKSPTTQEVIKLMPNIASLIHDFQVLSTTSVGTGLNDGGDLNSDASFAEGRRDPTMDVMALKDSLMSDVFFGNDSVAISLPSSDMAEKDSTSTGVNMDDMQQELTHDDLLQMDALDQHDHL
ncbi:hypothetical protein BGZ65_010024 [Modicella reniformis]|uniref:Uncharacterized protein n=1 Tax=Modicella reniformis TaxID=1440133 RepID=A0A9P6ISF5_9FUNG|nr:hypothetical protein BGZ65_010024 [Modicella reniformis]